MPTSSRHVIINETAEWMMRLQCGDLSPLEQQNFEQWRLRSPAHAQAWERAQSVLATFDQVPEEINAAALRKLSRPTRRRAILGLCLAGATAPLVWRAAHDTPWRAWSADYQTATGERRTVTLADGTQVVLNTNSAMDVVFAGSERRLQLRAGEILVTTGHEQGQGGASRPFIVETAQGTAQALGTRFSVRCLPDTTRLAVFEGAVAVHPRLAPAATTVVSAGQQSTFGMHDARQPIDADVSDIAWEQGMVIAKDMRLQALVAELARYRRGVLRTDPEVAELRVSGAFPLADIDASLTLLTRTLPVEIRSVTRYWTSVGAHTF